jgi:hypothetical protein
VPFLGVEAGAGEPLDHRPRRIQSRRLVSSGPKEPVSDDPTGASLPSQLRYQLKNNGPLGRAPRHLFDLGIGTDDLFRTNLYRTVARFTIVNLMNRVTLYNFLPTFSGTHFVTPRSYQAELGLVF